METAAWKLSVIILPDKPHSGLRPLYCLTPCLFPQLDFLLPLTTAGDEDHLILRGDLMHLYLLLLLRVWVLPEIFHLLHYLGPSSLQDGVGHCCLRETPGPGQPQT